MRLNTTWHCASKKIESSWTNNEFAFRRQMLTHIVRHVVQWWNKNLRRQGWQKIFGKNWFEQIHERCWRKWGSNLSPNQAPLVTHLMRPNALAKDCIASTFYGHSTHLPVVFSSAKLFTRWVMLSNPTANIAQRICTKSNRTSVVLETDHFFLHEKKCR